MRASVWLAFLLVGCSSVPPSSPPGPPSQRTLEARRELEVARSLEGYAEVAALGVPEPLPRDYQQGRILYAQNCASCHGEDGLGNGMMGRALKPPPRNLTSPREYKFGCRELAIFRSAKYSLPGGQMPAWTGRIADSELWQIVHYVRRLQRK